MADRTYTDGNVTLAPLNDHGTVTIHQKGGDTLVLGGSSAVRLAHYILTHYLHGGGRSDHHDLAARFVKHQARMVERPEGDDV